MDDLPTPYPARTQEDIRAFFNRFAASNEEKHGEPDVLLKQRLALLDRHVDFRPDDVVLDVGCGNGHHLRALSESIGRGIGIDLSGAMIDSARKATRSACLDFRADDAEQLGTVSDGSVDVVISAGVLEHTLRPGAVFKQVRRVLSPNGRFAMLTLNATFWWYRLADRLEIPTRHLETDDRLPPARARRIMRSAGLRGGVSFWSFVPEGDLPRPLAGLCRVFDAVGRTLGLSSLRGGLLLHGRCPAAGHGRAGECDRAPAEAGERDSPVSAGAR
jgi:2-polyprenyl-6-hydroxyphenyl methylase/3-demethylubiquinone-9 3-methyltransferase